MRQAHLSCVIAGVFAKKRGGGEFTISDFLPDVFKTSDEELIEMARQAGLRVPEKVDVDDAR